jgi:hypothetical protein
MRKISHPHPSANTGNESMNAQQFFVAIPDRIINLTPFYEKRKPRCPENAQSFYPGKTACQAKKNVLLLPR